MAVDHNNPQSRDEEILIATIDGNEYDKAPQSRMEELLLELKETIEEGGGGGGTTNYNQLENKPQIAGTELKGNKSLADLGIASATTVSGILDGTSIDSFADVETALAGKQNTLTFDNTPTENSTNPVKSGGIYSALAGKADTGIVADDFDSTASYVIGNYCIENGKLYRFKANHSGAWSASDVDEIQITGELATLKSGLTTLDNEVNGDATVYPYADVITIPDAVPANLADCNVKIEPIQDLHGYDKPWVGGAGKNKLLLKLTDIKSLNTAGTWSGNTYSINSATVTVQTDSNDNVTGILGNGTTTDQTIFYLCGFGNGFDASKYNGDILNGCLNGGSSYYVRISDVTVNSITNNNGDAPITGLTNTGKFSAYINIASGVTLTNQMFYPMIRLATETDATFAPYTNICPITGHTEASVEVTDGDETTKTYTIALGDTIYGGAVDFETGVMTVTHAYETITSMEYYGTYGDDNAPLFYKDLTNNYSLYKSNDPDDYKPISNAYDTWTADYAQSMKNGCFRTQGTGPTHRFYFRDDRFTSKSEIDAWLANNDVEVCARLATPIELQLTPQQIQLLKGQNTLTASTGQISVTVNGVSGSIGAVQEQVNGLAEEVEEIKPIDYSTTEQKTGQKWIDGRDVYIRTFDFSSSPVAVAFNTWTSLGVNIPNCDILLKCNATSGSTNLSASGIEFEIKSSENYGLYAEYNQNINIRTIRFIICEYVKK